MARLSTWLAGALGIAALWRLLKREHDDRQRLPEPAPDPAAELRARLDAARETEDDRDEFDAAEGQPVDEVERSPEPVAVEAEAGEAELAEAAPVETRSLDERRRAIHEKAQQALGDMRPADPDE